jgi:hypothetical protein
MIVKLPSVAGNEPFAWAMKNCPSFEKRTIETPRGEENPMFISRYDILYYHFGSEQDAVLFALRWS